MSSNNNAISGTSTGRRPSRIEELREQIESQMSQRSKKQKNAKNQRSSFHDNIFFKQDREKVIQLVAESQNKGKPKRKKKRKLGKRGANAEAAGKNEKSGTVSMKKVGTSTKTIKTSKKPKAQSKRMIKNTYLKGKNKVMVGTKGAKKMAAMFKKKPRANEQSEIEVPEFKNLTKMAKSLSPRTKKKIPKKASKVSRKSSPRKKPKKALKKSGVNEKVEEEPEEELNQLISESAQLHTQLERTIGKEAEPRRIKKSRSALGIKRAKSRTPNKRRLKNSSTIKNLNGKSLNRRPQTKRRKSKSATRETFQTNKKGKLDEVAFATEKKFMRMKSKRRVRPKEEYESGIPLRPKGKPKTKLKLKLKKSKRRKVKKKVEKNESEQANMSFGEEYESGFISEVQTRAIIPDQPMTPVAATEKKGGPKIPETAATVKKEQKSPVTRKQSESPEEYLQSLVLEQPEQPNRESISYKYFETDGKYSDGDDQAELKNSVFADNYLRQQDNDIEGEELLSSKFLDVPPKSAFDAEQIFEEITQKKSSKEVHKTLEKIQSINESHEKQAEEGLYRFIESKKQSNVECASETQKKSLARSKVKILSQTNIDFEGLIQQKSGEKERLGSKCQEEDEAEASQSGKAHLLALSDLAKQRVRVISVKALRHRKVEKSLLDRAEQEKSEGDVCEEPERERAEQGERVPLQEQFQVMNKTDHFLKNITGKAMKKYQKQNSHLFKVDGEKDTKSQAKKGLVFNGGKITNHFDRLRGRSSVAMSSFSVPERGPKQSTLGAIRESTKAKPVSMRDLVKRNTKKLVKQVQLESQKTFRMASVAEVEPEEARNEAEEEAAPQLNDEFQMMNWTKKYLKSLGKKVTSKVEFEKMNDDIDLIKSKIEITENNIQNDLQFFQEILDEEDRKEEGRLGESRVDVSKYFSKDESIILEEKEEEYFTYENTEDSMEDLRSIDFSKKETAQTERVGKEQGPGQEGAGESKPKVKFDYSIQTTNSIFIGKLNTKTQPEKKNETKEKPKTQTKEPKSEPPKPVPKTKKNSSDSMPIKAKKLKPKNEVSNIKKKSIEKPIDLSSGRTLGPEKNQIKAKMSHMRLHKKSFQDSIRESRILKINTVTDFDLKLGETSESETESEDSDWEGNFEAGDLDGESERSSKPSRLDSDYFLHKKGDNQILRILHESQRMLEVIRDEENEGSGRVSENEHEKFQKSQKIYFKESDLKGLTEDEKRIRNRIKTSNRLIRHIEQTQPDLESLSRKDVGEVKMLIEQPFKYRSFDKLTENEKKERIDLEMTYKQKIMEKINAIISKYSGKRQSELVSKEIENLVSGRTLQRWKNIRKGELTAILKIQRFFRFKIEEKIGKKIMEMQKEYYMSRASIINPQK